MLTTRYYRIRIRETDTGFWYVSVAEIVLGEHGAEEKVILPEGEVLDTSPALAVCEMLKQLGWYTLIRVAHVLAAAEDRVSITARDITLCPRLEPLEDAG